MSYQSLQEVLKILSENTSRITELESKNQHLKSIIDVITGSNTRSINMSLKCDYPGCSYSASYESVLVAHIRRHTGEKPFKCEWSGCGFMAARKDSLVRHHLTHTQGLTCDCGYNTKSRTQFKKHVNLTHKSLSAFQCHHDGCRRLFDTKYDLERHQESVHCKKELACSFIGCGKLFRKDRDLRAHMLRIHCDECPLVCEFPNCSFRTKFPNSLISHQSEHTGILPFICKHAGCNLAFKNMSSLRAHKHIHSNSPSQSQSSKSKAHNNPISIPDINTTHNGTAIPNAYLNTNALSSQSQSSQLFRCSWPECETTFSSSGALDLHINKMHKNERIVDYVCEYQSCGRRFFHAMDLENHQQWHIGLIYGAKHRTSKFNCLKCGAKYVDVRDMKKHAIRCGSDYINIKLNKVCTP